MAKSRTTRRRRAPSGSRRWLPVVVGLVLLVAVLSVAAYRLKLAGPAPRPTIEPPRDNPAGRGSSVGTAGPMRIMPLGDSLTEGASIPGGYRIDLWSRLAADGQRVDFVGSQSNGPRTLPDRDHEGHPGWRIDQIASSVESWLKRYRPQIVLLLIGTNDLVQNADVGAPDRLGALVDQIIATLPDCHVVVASIPPLRDRAWQRRAQTYNAAIPAIVSARGPRVSYVDAFGALDDADLIDDGIHLTASGDRKLADAWYTALRPLLAAPTSLPAGHS